MSNIRVELELKDGSFVSGMLRAGQSVESFKKELSRLDTHFRGKTGQHQFIRDAKIVGEQTRSMGQIFRDTSLAVGGLALALQAFMGGQSNFVGQITSVNAEMERLRYQMVGMSQAPGTVGDAMKDAAENVEYLRKTIKTVPFSLNELSSTFTKIKATGIDPTTKAIGALTDGISAMGGTDESLHRVTLGITQMSGKSVIQMEEMRQQLGEAMPNAMQLMARSVGVSVTQLTAAIGTGTLESKSALEAFYDELERTYGGSAQRMMETFSGQVSQVKANFQLLATSKGMSAYFNSQKDAMKEFNNFLSSPAAMNFANNLGTSMQSLVGWIVSGAEAFWRFREEIKLIIGAVAGLVILKTVGSAFSALTTSMTAANLRSEGFRSTMSNAAKDLTIFSQGIRVSGDRVDAAGIGMKAFLKGGTAAVGMLATWAPIIGIVGLAAYELGKHFGVFRKDVQDVTNSVAQMGAASREEAEKMIALNRENFQIERDNAKRVLNERRLLNNTPVFSLLAPVATSVMGDPAEAFKASMDDIEKRAAEMEARLGVFVAKSTTNESDGVIKAEQALIEGSMREMQKAYTDRQVLLDKERADRVSKAKETGEQVGTIDKEYQLATFENQKRIEEERIKFIDQAIAKQQQIAIAGTAEEAQRAAIVIAYFNEQRVKANQAVNNVGQQMQFLQPAKSIDDMMKKGDAALLSLTDGTAGLREELDGATTDAGKFLIRLERGDYGNIELGGEKFKELSEAIKGAAAEKEVLDKLLKGKKDLESDLKSASEKVASEVIANAEKSMGRTFTEGEKILQKMDNGDYFGYGPVDKVGKALDSLFTQTGQQGKALEIVGKIAREDTFGNDTEQKIQSTAQQVDLVKLSVMGLQDALNGVDFASAFSYDGGSFSNGIPGAFTDTSGAKNFLDLIGKAEGTDKGRGYNEVLGFGKYGGGGETLTNMNLKQVLDLGERIRQNSQKDGFNSSAVGRYQIVGSTMRELMEEMKLDPYRTKFTPEIQDQMAVRLMKRRGASVSGLRNEWEGLRRVDPTTIMDLYNKSASGVGPTRENSAKVALPEFYNRPDAPKLNDYTPVGGGAGPRATDTSRVSEKSSAAAELAALEAQRVQQKAAAAAAQAAEEKRARDAAAALSDRELGARETEMVGARADMFKELNKSIVQDETVSLKTSEHLRKVTEDIQAGKYGKNRIVGAPEYASLIKLAKEADAAETTREAREKAKTKVKEQQSNLEQQRLTLLEQTGEAERKLADPNYDRKSSGLIKLKKEMREYLDAVLAANNGDKSSKAYTDAEAEVNNLLTQRLKLDAIEGQTDTQKRTKELADSLLTQSQLRRQKYDEDMAMIDQSAEAMRAAGEKEVDIAKWVAEQKGIIDKQYAQKKNPISDQMKEWGDLQGNLDKAMTSWTDSAATGVSNLIMGTGDLSSAINGMMSDIVNMGVRSMFSKLKGDAGGAAPAAAGKAGKAGKSAMGAGGKGKLGFLIPGIAHTGAVVGSHKMTSSRPASLWSGAKRFHTGGIPLPGMGPKLLPSEVPIIARKGEGIFTPEQMSSLGGTMNSMGVTINSPVTVNANGGTQEQNADLAKQVARETEASMRSVVRDEIGRQFRPGAMLNRKN